MTYPATNYARACADGHVVFSALDAKRNALGIFLPTPMDPILKNLPAARATILPPALPTARLCYEDADNILQKVSSDGGPSQKAFDLPVFSRITISPDGKLAAFVTQRGADSKEKLALLPLDSSQPARFLEFERPRSEFAFSYTINPVVFSSDGKGMIYPTRNGDADNLWLQNLDGSPGKQLTDFKSEIIRDFDFSFDGKQLAVIRGHWEADVVLIRESEK